MTSLHGSLRQVSLALVALACADASGSTSSPPPGTARVGLDTVASGLDFPVGLASPPGDARLFVVEKAGRIRIIRDGQVQSQPFLDIASLVSGSSEQGLLGLAFAPDYATSGRFYLDYTDTNGDTRIVRYRRGADADHADPASAEILLTIDQPYSNHNGGQLAFGPDGFLYVAMGDGGSGGDPQGHGQNPDDLLGSLLRLDVAPDHGYAIPRDNPWASGAGGRPEVFNIGLRNPWRFSFDRATGDLYIGDVGQNEREEIDVATRRSGGGLGLNFGWNRMEGTACYRSATCDRSGLTLPVLDYTHANGCSVTGGYVYRGSAVPDLAGLYFYADYCQGWVRSIRFAGGTATESTSWPSLAPGGNITSFGQDDAGEVYVLTQGGGVFRFAAR